MTAEGHILFSIACAVSAKNAALTPILMQGDWWHIVPSAVLTCLLPDIDHPKSFLGQRLNWFSRPISRIFGHRGFTHSLLAMIILFILFYLKVLENWIIPVDAIQGMAVGYMSHILADMLTPSGVPFLWPFSWRFRLPILTSTKDNRLERILCIVLLVCAILMPQILSENKRVYFSSEMMNLL